MKPSSPQPSQPVPPVWLARAEEPMTFTDLQFVAALGVLTIKLLVLILVAMSVVTTALLITAVCKR
jgi:hypothetical protein